MEKRYLIKTTYVATEENENFKGETSVRYSGKENCNFDTDVKLFNYFVKNYGYSRLCDVKRVLNRVTKNNQKEEKYGFWNITSEIVEFEI